MTLGLSRNNPWDLLPEHIPWLGLDHEQPDNGPLAFTSMVLGIRAGVKLCYTYQERNWNTPLIFIPKFAPASAGNPVAQYVQNVCDWTGFRMDQALDFHDIKIMVPWAHAIFRQEQGADNGITDGQIIEAINLAEES